jgi:iron(III) transport system substrate-binding protein
MKFQLRHKYLLFVALASWIMSAKVSAAQSDISVTTHDEIVAKAKKEGALRVLNGFEGAAIKALREGFSKKYPFIKAYYEDVAGDAAQRLLLELKTGRPIDWDVVHVNASFYSEYEPYVQKIDLPQMAERGLLQIEPKMVSPISKSVVAAATILDVIVYNRKLLLAEDVPKSWEDLLKPEYKGKKIMLDIRPFSVAALVPAMGKEWVINYARRLAAQDPVWIRGSGKALTAMAAGEFALGLSSYHSVVVQKRRGGVDLEARFLEPIPVRLSDVHGILKSARHPHAAMLFSSMWPGRKARRFSTIPR